MPRYNKPGGREADWLLSGYVSYERKKIDIFIATNGFDRAARHIVQASCRAAAPDPVDGLYLSLTSGKNILYFNTRDQPSVPGWRFHVGL